jgi:formyl-CoA transferase
MLPEVELRDGSRVPLTGPVAKFSRTPAAIRTPAQALGAQNEAILEALGIDEAARRRLWEQGVV